VSWCIDTSSLIQAHRRAYPRSLFPSLWERLEALIAGGSVVAPDEVLKELSVEDDELLEWARTQRGLFVPLDAAQQDVVTRIVLPAYPARGLPEVALSKAWADPWVIALARLRGLRVVTEERKDLESRIPVVCGKVGVRCTNLLGLIEAEGWTF